MSEPATNIVDFPERRHLLDDRQFATERKAGIVLLVFPYGSNKGRANSISNGADRKQIAIMFREQAARFEGQSEMTGHA